MTHKGWRVVKPQHNQSIKKTDHAQHDPIGLTGPLNLNTNKQLPFYMKKSSIIIYLFNHIVRKLCKIKHRSGQLQKHN